MDILVKTMGDMEEEYKAFVTLPVTTSLDLSSWLPSFSGEVRPLVPGEFMAIIADTGVGKTAIAQNIAVATKSKVLLFELELPGTLCFERFLACNDGLSQKEVESLYINGETRDYTSINNISVCDQAGLTLDDIERTIEICRPDVAIIDYIGLLSSPKSRSRYERVSDAAEGIKVVAKKTNTIMVATCQIHRKGDDYPDEVYIHDAKDSGSIESSAGVLLGAWRDPEDPTKYMFIKVLKNTKGPAGHKARPRCDLSKMRIYEEDMTDNEITNVFGVE